MFETTLLERRAVEALGMSLAQHRLDLNGRVMDNANNPNYALYILLEEALAAYAAGDAIAGRTKLKRAQHALLNAGRITLWAADHLNV